MFRKLAGRPTSNELEAKRLEMAAAQKIDSIKLRKQVLGDSLSVEEQQRQEQVKLKTLDRIDQLYSEHLDNRYYVIIGSFRDSSNINRMLKDVSAAGYIPARIDLGNGFVSVGVAADNTYYEAIHALVGLKKEAFCPPDAWLLINK